MKPVSRRRFLAEITVTAAFGAAISIEGGRTMYGLIGKVTTVEGMRDAFADVLLQGTAAMPGCLSYIVAKDPADANALWITEVWDSRESHQASLSLPAVRAAIAKGKPMIAGFGDRVETVPIGGLGLPAR